MRADCCHGAATTILVRSEADFYRRPDAVRIDQPLAQVAGSAAMSPLYRTRAGRAGAVMLPLRSLSGRLAAVILSLGVTATTASATPTGTISAVASAPLPPQISIAVAAKEANERNDVLQPAIEAMLSRRGYRVDAQGSWQLQFATAVEILPRDRSMVHLRGRIGSDSKADLGLEVPLPQWPWPAAPGSSSVYRYTVWMTLGATGRPAIWQGAASTVLAKGESLATDQALADALLAILGKSVASQPLELPEPPPP